VDYKSSRKQPYMEIQLDIQGCKDIYDSLERFCAEERMDGQNKYNAEGFGLQVIPFYSYSKSHPRKTGRKEVC